MAEIAEVLLNDFLNKFKCAGKNIRLFRKIVSLMSPIPYPGELKNIIRASVAFSNPSDEFDYLKRFYKAVYTEPTDIHVMQSQGFTVREIEILTGISKSQVSRELKED